MFKKMLQAVGIGGPSVDTVVHGDPAFPGGHLTGEVRVGGASAETDIQRITLSLVAEVEAGEDKQGMEFRRVEVADEFHLAAEENHTIPFTIELPWETPVTSVRGESLRGMRLGIATQVAVAKAVDTSDLDPVRVEPLAAQQRVIDAMLAMGATVKHTDLQHGHIRGSHQELPFYQEIEFFAPPAFAGRLAEIELTFLARPDGLDVVLEADRRGGLLTSGGDALGRIHRGHEEALETDWESEISDWLHAVAERGHGIHGVHGHRGGHERGGSGMGGMVAAGVGGLAAGMVVGEMLEGEEGEEALAGGMEEEMEMEEE